MSTSQGETSSELANQIAPLSANGYRDGDLKQVHNHHRSKTKIQRRLIPNKDVIATTIRN